MLTLNNLIIPGRNNSCAITVNGEKIAYLGGKPHGAKEIEFHNAVVFPGLINSHDHLDFNLFPQLGKKIYNNYIAWGTHIHKEYQSEIEAVLKVPAELRIAWGIYKNLLCGVTTVVNHGETLSRKRRLINVLEHEQSIHSVGFDKYWKLRLNNPLKMGRAAVVHIAEGVDPGAAAEPDKLTNWNLLRRKLIAVHGVAMNAKQAAKFRALVWCPESNFFLLNATAPVNLLKRHLPIAFGTDSTLTGNWDIWQHIRLAQQTGLLSNEELWNSLNTVPAALWQRQAGILAPGYDADLVVVRGKAGWGYSELLNLKPEDFLLVMQGGNIRLFDEMLFHQIKHLLPEGFSKIKLRGNCKYVTGDLPGLMNSIIKYHSNAQFPVVAA